MRTAFLLRLYALATLSSLDALDATAAEPTSPLVASARLVGELFHDNQFHITGQDAATSLTLPGGEALWVFGDTIEGPFQSIREVDLKDKLSNTACLVPQQDAAQGLPKFRFLATPDGQRPRQIVPFRADEEPEQHRVWPMHGLCVGKKAYLFYHRISLKPGVDVFEDFTLDGMGLARAELGDAPHDDGWQFERLAAPDGSQEFWKGDQPGFGVFVVERDGYVYLWGSQMTGMFLARTRSDAVERLDRYEYLAAAPTLAHPDVAPRWSSTFAPTAPLFDGVPNEMSASFNEHLGCFIAVHCRLRDNQIVMRTAPHITGPWSVGEVIFEPSRNSDKDLFYAAKEHPELARDGGKTIYLSFVNSATYVPQLVEVRFVDDPKP